ncbi:MAG: ice-binding family protein [Rhizomicrobium sp.]|jgi:hypothetical protein
MIRHSIAGGAIAALFACSAATAQSAAGETAISAGYSGFGQTQPVNLGGAGHFVILSKSGITDVKTSDVVGNIGTSPITGAADHLSCAEVTGKVYSVNAAGPAPCSLKSPTRLSTAVFDMETAYTDAAGRKAGATGLGAGNIGGLTLGPGVYKWSTSVTIPKSVTLDGDSHSVWIFEISKDLNISDGKAVILSGNAQAQNIFWQVAGQVTLGTTSHFEGIILSKTLIAMKTGASINGRLLAQTAVTLQMNDVTAP